MLEILPLIRKSIFKISSRMGLCYICGTISNISNTSYLSIYILYSIPTL
jgi:hypothetical protein